MSLLTLSMGPLRSHSDQCLTNSYSISVTHLQLKYLLITFSYNWNTPSSDQLYAEHKSNPKLKESASEIRSKCWTVNTIFVKLRNRWQHCRTHASSSPERTGCVYGCESQSCKACIYLYKTPTRSILTFSRADCRLLVSLCLHNEWENCFINPICWQSKRWFSSRSFRFPDIMLWCHQFSWWLRNSFRK